jgi:hypothetical protein
MNQKRFDLKKLPDLDYLRPASAGPPVIHPHCITQVTLSRLRRYGFVSSSALANKFATLPKKQNPQLLLRVTCCPRWNEFEPVERGFGEVGGVERYLNWSQVLDFTAKGEGLGRFWRWLLYGVKSLIINNNYSHYSMRICEAGTWLLCSFFRYS